MKALFPFIALSLTVASCATRQVGVCGNARFGYELSPDHPHVERPVDSRAGVTLVAVRRDGTVVLQFPEHGRRVTLKPRASYFNPKVSDATLTVDSSDPLTGRVQLAEQIIP